MNQKSGARVCHTGVLLAESRFPSFCSLCPVVETICHDIKGVGSRMELFFVSFENIVVWPLSVKILATFQPIFGPKLRRSLPTGFTREVDTKTTEIY